MPNHRSPRSATRQTARRILSTTGVDCRGLVGTPVDSKTAGKRLKMNPLGQKSHAVTELEKLPRSGSTPAASTTLYV